jgi:hypothetical protein
MYRLSKLTRSPLLNSHEYTNYLLNHRRNQMQGILLVYCRIHVPDS